MDSLLLLCSKFIVQVEPVPVDTRQPLDTRCTSPSDTLPLQDTPSTLPLAGSKARHKHLPSALADHNTIP